MVEVVVGALLLEGRVLLAHRRPDKHAYPGVWDLPGGVVEDGETELVASAVSCARSSAWRS
ncbi:NUDIX domain-containing protein [Nocardioides sp. S-58]|uniref:NUDIX domain-containing protein n=1 Tax=Nocardioides renjunii TaxID=3095075 RepID=A0ABU5KD80_9ACTN|nr:NUDIX domain-containing protein [Nocardioides sp. S-58]MDZ5662409.1 NUDIX domain-containing protein [Nocardioides sp. S-58]